MSKERGYTALDEHGMVITCKRKGVVYFKDKAGNRHTLKLGLGPAYDQVRKGMVWLRPG